MIERRKKWTPPQKKEEEISVLHYACRQQGILTIHTSNAAVGGWISHTYIVCCRKAS